ncbi:MAG: hypothetical protein Q7S66_05850 [bacterium]|nr:hypothetical protein [bacterium]
MNFKIVEHFIFTASFKQGQAMITMTVIMLFVGLLTFLGISLTALNEAKVAHRTVSAEQSFFAAEAGVEDMTYRYKSGKQTPSSTTLTIGGSTAVTTVTAVAGGQSIVSEGQDSVYIRKVEGILTTTSGASFSYGAQVGDGGLDMKNTSRVNGSVYSSGSITGENSPVITGDAFVAVATLSSKNQSWEVQNADFAVGTITGSVNTIVESSNDVGKYSSMVLGSDGFARISHYDASDRNLKFTRCTNADCISKNTATVESSNDTGQYTSLALGSDGFARIAYYYVTSGDLKFVRCTNADCTSKNTATVESSNDAGLYASLALGSDDFGRISYYNTSNDDLKFVLCLADGCSASVSQIDAAQSFQPSITDRITRAELYIKKFGAPSAATFRLVRDSGGAPSTNAGDVLATAAIDPSGVASTYGWLVIDFSSVVLNDNTTYWLLIDASLDYSNYYFLGEDVSDAYSDGTGKRTSDWSSGGWAAAGGDFDFRVYMGGTNRTISGVTINGNANGHTIDDVTVGGNVNAFSYNDGTVTGNINADSISECTINGNASYNSIINCSVVGNQVTPTTPPADPPVLPMPITEGQLDAWEQDAEDGGVISSPCPYKPADGATIGPKKINCDVEIDGSNIVTLTGVLWISGNFEMKNSAQLILAPSFGSNSGVVIVDKQADRLTSSKVIIGNTAEISGSGQTGSYIMLASRNNSAEVGGAEEAVNIGNSSSVAIYYAPHGLISLPNTIDVKEATGYKLQLRNSAAISYESGLANLQFSSGPTGSWKIKSWQETQ